jgi:hypothetical protein
MKYPVVWTRNLSKAVNSTSSEIPKTRYGTTSGEKNSAEVAAFPANRRRSRANDASTPSVTAIRLEAVATIRLRRSASSSSGFVRNLRYQSVVKLSSGKVTSPELNEKIARTAIGR